MYNFKYKDCDPNETISLCKNIISSFNFDIKEDITKISNNLYSVNLMDTISGMVSNGKGVTEDYALASGYAEFLERIQNALFVKGWNNDYGKFEYYPDEYQDTAQKILENQDIIKDIEMLFVVSNNRYPYNIEELISFLKVLNNNEDYYKFVDFYSINKKTTVGLPVNILKNTVYTTGMCAGNSREEAIAQGLFEICERWVNFYCWSNNLTPPEVPRNYIQNNFPDQYEEILEIENLNPNTKIYVYDYSLGKDIKLPVVAILYVDQKLQRFRMQFGSHIRFDIALERCLTELVQGYDCTNEVKNINNLTTIDWELSGSWESRENKHRILDFSVGKIPFYLFTSSPSWNFYPWEEIDNYNSKESFKIIRDRILNISTDIYIRDNSYLGFNSYYIYVPSMSMLPIDKTNYFSNIRDFDCDVNNFPDSYLSMTDEDKKIFCLNLINNMDSYTDCDYRIKDPDFLFKIAVLIEQGFLEEAYNFRIFFPKYSKYEIIFEDIRLSLLGFDLEQRRRCLQKMFDKECFSYWDELFSYRNNLVSKLSYYNYKEIHYEDTYCPKNPLNLVKDAFTKKVIDQNSLSVLGE